MRMTPNSRRAKILFLAHLLPWPLEGGGQIKSYNTLRILSATYDITLLAFIRRPGEEQSVGPLLPFCVGGVKTVRLPRGGAHDAAAALAALIKNQSFLINRDAYAGMRKAVEELLGAAAVEGMPYDAIHVDHLQMMSFAPDNTDTASGRARVPVVLDEHNVEYLIPQRIGEGTDGSAAMRWFAGREWPHLRDFEREACRRADVVLAVSREDARALIELDPPALSDKVSVVPIGVDLEAWGEVNPRADADEILSIGTMYWPPNVDAILWFCAEILPLVRSRMPNVRLTVVGARPTAAIRALAEYDPLITVTGLVEDVRPYAQSGGVFIVPLRAGSGMRVKILTAMAMGLAVVSTTVGAEGIEVTDGENIVLADYPRAFANAVIDLLKDRERAAHLGQAGRKLMEDAYGWDAVGRQLLAVYETLLGCEGQADRPISLSRVLPSALNPPEPVRIPEGMEAGMSGHSVLAGAANVT